MRYLGGKTKHAKKISDVISTYINNEYYFEPFCGSFAVGSLIKSKKLANDLNPYIVSLLSAISNGYNPPDIISEEYYKEIKTNKENFPKELVGFVGFGCSFSGKFFGGYARNGKRNRVASLEAKRSLLKIKDGLQNTIFTNQNYKLFKPKNMIIYCDPPYKNTTGYSYGKNFNSDEFWDIMKGWSKNNKVFVSEFDAPDFCEVLLEWKLKTNFNGTGISNKIQSEKLFLVK